MNAFSDVKQIIHDTLGIPLEEIETDRTLEELHFCSLDIMEIVMVLEEKFDIAINDEDEEKIRTVGDLVEIVSAA